LISSHFFENGIDHKKFELLLKKMVDITKSQSGCYYFGFTKCGDKVKSREGWVDVAQMELTAPFLVELFQTAIANLDTVEMIVPPDQMENAMQILEPYGGDGYHVLNGSVFYFRSVVMTSMRQKSRRRQQRNQIDVMHEIQGKLLSWTWYSDITYYIRREFISSSTICMYNEHG
jgi:hypothetical protein